MAWSRTPGFAPIPAVRGPLIEPRGVDPQRPLSLRGRNRSSRPFPDLAPQWFIGQDASKTATQVRVARKLMTRLIWESRQWKAGVPGGNAAMGPNATPDQLLISGSRWRLWR